MTQSATDFRIILESNLKASSVNEDAASMKAYMKDNFEYIGVKSANRKLALRRTISELGLPENEQFELVIRDLWNSPYREVHYCSQEILHRKKWWKQEGSIKIIEYLMRHNQWWDSIDYIASNLVGSYYHFHGVDKNRIQSWNSESNIWIVRTSILFQLKYKNEVDLVLLNNLIIPHLASDEFFIQKAVGWILRQVSKTDPQYVRSFLRDHKVKPVSYREAIKYI